MKIADRVKNLFIPNRSKNLSAASDHRSIKKQINYNVGTFDGLINAVSGIGTAKDKDTYANYTIDSLKAWSTLIAAYRTSWICGKIIDIPAEEMTREWRYFTTENPVLREAMINAETKYNLKALFRQSIKWSRLFGGACIFIGTNDGDLRLPLDINNLKKDSLRFLRVLDNRIVYPLNMGNVYNPSSANFMDPEFYLIANNYGEDRAEIAQQMGNIEYVFGEIGTSQPVIHKSRIIRFDGIPLPLIEFLGNRGWGDSVLNRVFKAVSHLDTVHDAIATMVHEADVPTFKIKDLSTILKSPNGQGRITNRLRTSNLVKSIVNMWVLDKDNEEFERKPISFASLDLILQQNMHICAAASDIPATRLLGSSPDGLNSSGESDLRNFYDSIRSSQVEVMTEKLKYIDKIIAISEFGEIPDDLKFEYNPLWQMTDKELAEIQNMKSQRDATYLTHGVITPAIVAAQLRTDEVYVGITEETVKELEEMESFSEEELLENTETNSTENPEFNSETEQEQEFENEKAQEATVEN